MPVWEEFYEKKKTTAKEAIKKIKHGDRIFIGTGCSIPQTLVKELVNEEHDIVDAEIYHLLTEGDAPYIKEEFSGKFRTQSFYISENIRQAVNKGGGDYIPINISEIPYLFRSGKLPLDIVLIQTSPPDRNGNLSLGVSVDIVKSAVENGLTIIAEVNNKMPRTMGDSFIPLDLVDSVIVSDSEIVQYPSPDPDPVTESIALNIASLVEDGSTLELGIGVIPQAVLRYLKNKKDLGIHTEMFTDPIIPLIESGVINGSRKSINRGKITASFCMGTRKLFDFINENPIFEFRPSEYVNDTQIISQHRKMIAINSALQIDMTGQVCLDSYGFEFYNGIGGVVDFCRGAASAKEGKTIIALPSTTEDGKKSRIVANLTEGSGVVLSRADTRYVVTEYGVADLYGKNIRERVLALAEIAHPDFRNDILKEAKKHKYVYSHQKELPKISINNPREYERTRALSDATKLFVRPIRPSDEKALRDMFYALSEKSIAFRFFEPTKAFPQKFIQDFTTIDFSKDMAIGGFVKDLGGEQIVGVAHYYLKEDSKRANISFVVRDDWQAKGIGTDLLNIMSDIAKERGLTGFEAKVSAENQQMLSVFYNSGYEITTKREKDSYLITFDFDQQ
ncbi:GNAT family N-acetyltransferase [Chitinispirillales bacterium ANBcel5]|uniref:GNAT family N-acetyltransferase n=1 Tax=Cellulosispirillum alkaliphilum TaxID=3039283 RepID=UPI002A581BD0|nr:GNAT family N-acetyltransferase [Chitinispirillales bacterium ANBcel5]